MRRFRKPVVRGSRRGCRRQPPTRSPKPRDSFAKPFIMPEWTRLMKEASTVSESFRHILETFDNQYPERQYTIRIVCPEFTSVCPKTGQPDFGTLTITYVPNRKCVELKSLKFYLQQYRNEGIFYEHVTNRILDDLVAVVEPRRMTIEAAFHARGGIATTVTAQFSASSGQPEANDR